MYIELPNPLNYVERRQVRRLWLPYLPDFVFAFSCVVDLAKERSISYKKLVSHVVGLGYESKLISHCLDTVICLGEPGKIIMHHGEGIVPDNLKSPEDLTQLLQNMEPCYTQKSSDDNSKHTGYLKTYNNCKESILTKWGIFHVLLDHLVREAYWAQMDCKKMGYIRVDLRVEGPEKYPQDALFKPDDAKNYKSFIPFTVHFTGKSLSQDQIISEFMTPPAETEIHLGWYLIGLITKALRIPISVKSEPLTVDDMIKCNFNQDMKVPDIGKTAITVYHPLYLRKKIIV